LSARAVAIPIQNIYYLLCYAWNKLDEKEQIEVGSDDVSTLIDLLAKVLISHTRHVLKTGLTVGYVEREEELFGIRGKLNLNQTLKRNLLRYGRADCTYDERSPDILLNQILYSTICILIKTKMLHKELKAQLLQIKTKFEGVSFIKIKYFDFQKIIINRNTKTYAVLIKICELLHENILPAKEPGVYLFSDFTEDSTKMNRLFEEFIRNFYRIEQRQFSVSAAHIHWRFQSNDPSHMMLLPLMKTDISLESVNHKIIIDAKYYAETMSVYYNKKTVRSAHLYQLFSYLVNQRDGSVKKQHAKGILIYPCIDTSYDLNYRFEDHDIWVRSLDLNTSWQVIAQRLLDIVKIPGL
jgi:5-methylcytosine-specific restriction enzyme subunit McrC